MMALRMAPKEMVELLKVMVSTPDISGTPPIMPISGLIRLSTMELTTVVTAEPMTTPTAMSIIEPREMNFLKPPSGPLSARATTFLATPPVTLSAALAASFTLGMNALLTIFWFRTKRRHPLSRFFADNPRRPTPRIPHRGKMCGNRHGARGTSIQ